VEISERSSATAASNTFIQNCSRSRTKEADPNGNTDAAVSTTR
jgi:hypothetical protein